jgi:hypothetical protein
MIGVRKTVSLILTTSYCLMFDTKKTEGENLGPFSFTVKTALHPVTADQFVKQIDHVTPSQIPSDTGATSD